MDTKHIIHSGNGGYLRRSIGFKSEIVEDREDHDTFPVQSGAAYMPANDDGMQTAEMPPHMTPRRKAKR